MNRRAVALNSVEIEHVAIDLQGGVGTVVRELSGAQAAKGRVVSVLSSFLPSDSKLFQCSVTSTSSNSKKIPGRHMLLGVPGVRLERGERKIVHYHGLASIGAFRKKASKDTVEICTLHGIGPDRNYQGVNGILIKRILNRKKLSLVAVDECTADFFSRYTTKKIHVVPNGIRDIEMVPHKITQTTICFVGVIDELKGADVLFSAIVRGIDEGCLKGTRFLFAGDDSTDLALELRRQMKDRPDLSDSISFLGQVENAGLKVIPECDAVVLPSKTEGLPMSLLEALRAGKAIVATPVGGIPDLVVNGENGFLIERNIESLLSALSLLCADADLLESMGKKSRSRYLSRYSADMMMDSYDELYASLLGEG